MWRIFPLGLEPGKLPTHKDIVWQAAIDQPNDAVLVSNGCRLEQWEDVARRLPSLVPIAVLGSKGGDVEGDAVCPDLTSHSLDDALASLGPIQDRILKLPDLARSNSPDRDKLNILALSYTRDMAIDARRQPLVPSTVVYPLLRHRPGIVQKGIWSSLETLSGLDLLERRFATRVFDCPSCGSGRLSAYEACVECGSANLLEEPLIHHYRCGFQDSESSFLKDNDLICPKCKKRLRHFGVDYGRAGVIVRCLTCRQVMAEPQAAFRCLDCGAGPRGDEARPHDWHHYSLTPHGVSALQRGALPTIDVKAMSRQFPRTHSWKDFSLLVSEQIRIATRYERDVSVGRIRVANLEELRHAEGNSGTSEILQLLAGIIVENSTGGGLRHGAAGRHARGCTAGDGCG